MAAHRRHVAVGAAMVRLNDHPVGRSEAVLRGFPLAVRAHIPRFKFRRGAEQVPEMHGEFRTKRGSGPMGKVSHSGIS